MLLGSLATFNVALTIGYVSLLQSLGLLIETGATAGLGLLWWLLLSSLRRWMRNVSSRGSSE